MAHSRTEMVGTVPTEDRFTRLLFRLPAEIRNEIYSYAVPKPPAYMALDLRHPHSDPNLLWTACSQRLFAEAGPLYYGAIVLYTCTTLSGEAMYSGRFDHGDTKLTSATRGKDNGYSRSLSDPRKTFDKHLFHYGSMAYPSLRPLIYNMPSTLAIDIRVDTCQSSQTLSGPVSQYFRDLLAAFPRLKTIYVFFGPPWMLYDPAGMTGTRHLFESDPPSPHASDDHFRGEKDAIRRLVPADCELRWRVSPLWAKMDGHGAAGRQPVI
ncbi:hypothetical protein BAUCODRAFT_268531 [Baudoinia panamericana UAMH 10762]|uniref:Uncharacterized protein n=1 Tax=Baudoinia panamericana (strain UAMH 10762) TaxID=717646 RepID=M2M992_BAUPA|nr:uncharacterized protein BAUCODRAFT_268531 [Baudoinia panamericana UAMH 10762]EMC92961.1 hypothetical protein BAUCODRAFT_268531 [Baudoinia panamericana UAMH 10762]